MKIDISIKITILAAIIGAVIGAFLTFSLPILYDYITSDSSDNKEIIEITPGELII
ncbi:MAG: hypothetical protein P9L97_08010 [Candidatus Tenebribacter davisii]|jgi:hypothetical protein|nr:hypothetical protein [Candidatus Tenebribacter davisii]